MDGAAWEAETLAVPTQRAGGSLTHCPPTVQQLAVITAPPPSRFDGRNQGEVRVESKLSSGEQGEGGHPSSMVFTLATAAFGWRLKMTVAVEGERVRCGWLRDGPPATMGSIFGGIRWTVAEL